MITVRQWVIGAFGLFVIVSVSTYQLLNMQVPRTIDRQDWAKFIAVHVPGSSHDVSFGMLWTFFMGVQALQLVLGIPFLHVTQISMSFVLNPAVALISSCVLEFAVMCAFIFIQSNTVQKMDEDFMKTLDIVDKSWSSRVFFSFCVLMSSVPMYIGVVVVHVGVVSRRDFVVLALAVSGLSVSKNVALGVLLRDGHQYAATAVLGLVVFVSPILFTLLTVVITARTRRQHASSVKGGAQLEEVCSLAGSCVSEPSRFEQHDATTDEDCAANLVECVGRMDDILGTTSPVASAPVSPGPEKLHRDSPPEPEELHPDSTPAPAPEELHPDLAPASETRHQEDC